MIARVLVRTLWPGREDLRDHATHRGADDVRRVDLQVVEQRGGVVGDVLQRVDGRTAQAEKRADHPRCQRRTGVAAGHLRRQADVAVVVADDAQALVDELLAELLAPQQQLRAETHDQQDGRIVGIAHVLVVDFDVAGLRPDVAAYAAPRDAGTNLHLGFDLFRMLAADLDHEVGEVSRQLRVGHHLPLRRQAASCSARHRGTACRSARAHGAA